MDIKWQSIKKCNDNQSENTWQPINVQYRLPCSILYNKSANKEVFTLGIIIFKPTPLSIGNVVLRLLLYSNPKFLTVPAKVIDDPIGKTIPPSIVIPQRDSVKRWE